MNAIVYNGEKTARFLKILLSWMTICARREASISQARRQDNTSIKKYEKEDCCERVLTEGVSHATTVTKRLWNYSLIDLGITTKDTNI